MSTLKEGREWVLPKIIFKKSPGRENYQRSVGSLALRTWTLGFAIAQVGLTLSMAYVLKCLWAIKGARNETVLKYTYSRTVL